MKIYKVVKVVGMPPEWLRELDPLLPEGTLLVQECNCDGRVPCEFHRSLNRDGAVVILIVNLDSQFGGVSLEDHDGCNYPCTFVVITLSDNREADFTTSVAPEDVIRSLSQAANS